MTNLLKIATDPYRYDSIAVDWSKEGIGIDSPNRAHYWSFIEPIATGWTGMNVIDIGAGTGWLADALMKRTRVKYVLAMDPSRKNIKIGRKLYPDVEMVRSTLENFTTDRKFNVAISVLSLLHIHPLKSAFEKISNLLTPSGVFVAIVPDYDYFRSSRKGRKPQIEELGNDECVTMITRDYGVVADIVRSINKYIYVANEYGFKISMHIAMPHNSDERKKYPELKNTPITQLLTFKRIL